MVKKNNGLAVLFPGQGAQYVGMGRELYDACPEARRVFDDADRVLGFGITTLMFDGPEETLTETANSQPAIFAMSYAAWEALKSRAGYLEPRAFAGLSLGEYTALAAAGAVSFDDGLRIVRKRGEYMEEACRARPGTMASVIGLPLDDVRRVCEAARQYGVVDVANANSPGQVVVSGEKAAVEAAGDLARSRGAKTVIALKVSGAFHSRLMEEAERRLSADLKEIPFVKPRVPVVANVTAEEESDPEQIRGNLARQVTGSTLWQKSVEFLVREGVNTFVEVGCGTVLQGLVRRISPDAVRLGVENASTLEATAEALRKRETGRES